MRGLMAKLGTLCNIGRSMQPIGQAETMQMHSIVSRRTEGDVG
jgi:hypothetical protein